MKHRSSKEFVPATAHASLTTGHVIRMLRDLKGWTHHHVPEIWGQGDREGSVNQLVSRVLHAHDATPCAPQTSI